MAVLIMIIALLWLIAVLLLFANHQQKTNLWYSAFLFCLSLGYFVAILKNYLIPAAIDADAAILRVIAQFLSALGYRLCPYLLLMVGVTYTIHFSSALKKRLSYWLLLPFVITFGLDLLYPQYGFLTCFIPRSPLFVVTTVYAIPYGFCANLLLFQAFLNETDPRLRQQRFWVFAVTAPTLLNIVISYTPKMLHINEMWIFNMFPAFLMALFALVLMVRTGLMGMRISIERTTVDNTVKAVSTGTSLLNHTFKNELQNIFAGVEVLRQLEPTQQQNRIIDLIQRSAQNLLATTVQIQQRIQETPLNLTPCRLDLIVAESLEAIQLVAARKQVVIIPNLDQLPELSCDRAQLLEVLSNLYHNSLEAMPCGGRLEVRLFAYRRSALIRVADTGNGISKQNLSRVIEPFFTTKPRCSNYGLGLTYCYNVLRKHGGSFTIASSERQGTTVTLRLPLPKNGRITKFLPWLPLWKQLLLHPIVGNKRDAN